MTAYLKFDLPEDQNEYDCASHASKYLSVLTEMDNWLRNKVKYSEVPECAKAAFDEARKALYEIRHDYGVIDE